MLYCIIECVGGGGGGGGVASASAATCNNGGGGGGGAYSRKFASSSTIGASQTVTIGPAGSAGASGNNAGGNSSTATSVGSICTANGEKEEEARLRQEQVLEGPVGLPALAILVFQVELVKVFNLYRGPLPQEEMGEFNFRIWWCRNCQHSSSWNCRF